MEIRPSSNLVIPGAWNTSILMPTWFAQNLTWLGISGDVPIEVSLKAPHDIRFKVNNVLVQPTTARLDFVAQEETEECYQLISKIAFAVVEKLPHTPVGAIGHNVHFNLSQSEGFRSVPGTDLDKLSEFYRKQVKGTAVNQMQVQHAILYSDHVLNLTYITGRVQRSLSFNYHYAAAGGDDLKKFVGDFPRNMVESQRIADSLVEKE